MNASVSARHAGRDMATRLETTASLSLSLISVIKWSWQRSKMGKLLMDEAKQTVSMVAGNGLPSEFERATRVHALPCILSIILNLRALMFLGCAELLKIA